MEDRHEVWEKYWAIYGSEEEGLVYDAEIVVDPEVLSIVIQAQRNETKLDYWQEIATGLAALVDRLRAEQNEICSLLYAMGIPSASEDGRGENPRRLRSLLRRLQSRNEPTLG